MALGRVPLIQPTHSLILAESFLLDEPHDRLYLFVSSSESGGKIDFKTTSMSSPSFPDGNGNPFHFEPDRYPHQQCDFDQAKRYQQLRPGSDGV